MSNLIDVIKKRLERDGLIENIFSQKYTEEQRREELDILIERVFEFKSQNDPQSNGKEVISRDSICNSVNNKLMKTEACVSWRGVAVSVVACVPSARQDKMLIDFRREALGGMLLSTREEVDEWNRKHGSEIFGGYTLNQVAEHLAQRHNWTESAANQFILSDNYIPVVVDTSSVSIGRLLFWVNLSLPIWYTDREVLYAFRKARKTLGGVFARQRVPLDELSCKLVCFVEQKADSMEKKQHGWWEEIWKEWNNQMDEKYQFVSAGGLTGKRKMQNAYYRARKRLIDGLNGRLR